MWLTRGALQRPFLTAVLAIALVIMGAIGMSRLPVDLNPQAELATLTVTCIYPGAGPNTVETLIAKPLEECLKGVPQLKHVNSFSQDSVCFGYLDFETGTDTAKATTAVRDALSSARSKFPDAMQDPQVAVLDINAQPVLFLGLVGPESPDELRKLAEDVVQPRLSDVKGVTDVEVLGGQTRRVEVQVDREKLARSGLLLSKVNEVLGGVDINAPGGSLQNGNQQRAVRVVGELKTLDDLRSTPLPPPDNPGKMIEMAMRPQPAHPVARAARLSDIADVKLTATDEDVRVRLQQQAAVGIIVTKRGDGNTVKIAEEALEAAHSAPLPNDVKILTARNTARTVDEALSDVNTSLWISVILCALVMWLFLRNFRTTIIVVCTIPVCLFGAMAPLKWAGHTLNQMTMLGMAISIGFLIDDAIVCIEAITHRLQRGEKPGDAAFNGRNDIALADTSTTLLDLAVYGPIAVMTGVVGQFFRDFGFVVAVATGLSLLTAFTIVPVMAAHFFRAKPLTDSERNAESKTMNWVYEHYQAALQWALHHRLATLCIGWGTLAAAGALAALSLGIDFIPSADLSTVVVNAEMPAGSSADATTATIAEAEKYIAQLPEVETIFTTVGRVEVGFGIVSRMGPQYAQINVTLRDKRGVLDRLMFRTKGLRTRTDDAVAEDIRGKLSVIPSVTFQVIAVHGWGGAGAPIDFSLYGKDFAKLAAAGDEIMAGLRQLPSLTNPDMAWRLGDPEVQVTVNRDRARELYVYPGLVARELRAAVAGDTVGQFMVGDDYIPIFVQLKGDHRRNAADVGGIPVGTNGTRAVTVADVADIKTAAGPTRIDRRDGEKQLNFKTYLAAGVNLGAAQSQIQELLEKVGVPLDDDTTVATRYPGVRWEWSGDAATLSESSGAMIQTGLIGLVLSYLVMAILFNSALHPFTILLSVPMAGAGGLLLLVLTGSSLSIVSGIGFILLIGIVVRNAILLLDYTIQLRHRGVERTRAVIHAGIRRLRPIFMTTFTTVVGMLPVAFKIGKGAEIRAPMAIAVIGGLTLATLLTLIIIPVTYTLFDDWFGGQKAFPPPRDDAPLEDPVG